MTLLQMSYILEVDRCGSMNRAARNLFLSQSALSAAIAEVERELGVTIFLRTNRGVTLTEEGRELTAQIAPLVERSRKLERYYSERRAADRVSLSVASQRYPFCAKAFVEFLHLLDEPHIQVSFKEMEMAAVIDEVTARRSAFGIIFVSDMTEHFIGRILREKNLTFQPLVDIRPRVFLRKGHPLSGERAVRLEQLYAYPYAVFTQSDSNYHFAEEAVVGTGAEFDRVVSVSDRATAYNVMAHTDCVSTGSGVLPDGYGDDRLMTLPLIGDVPDMRLGVIRPRDVPLTDYGEGSAMLTDSGAQCTPAPKPAPPLRGGSLYLPDSLLHADGFDLHQRAPGQRTDLHGAAGRVLPLSEELSVDRVHGGEVAHALQEYGGLDHIVHGQTGGFKDGLDVGEYLTGLLGNAAGDELAGSRVKGHLAGRDQEAAAVDGLGIGTDGGGGIGGGNDLLHGDDLL